MHKFVFICVILLPGLLIAQKSTPQEEEVQQIVREVFEVLSTRDTVALRKLCTADVRFYEYGQVWPLDTLIKLAVIRNTDPDFKRTNTLDFIQTTIRDNVAWTTYNLHSSITRNGKQTEVYWQETVVLLREKKKWKVNTLHSTRINK